MKSYITQSKDNLQSGVVKYHDIAFWWRKDKDKMGYTVRRWWNFRRAYKSGILDLYSTFFLSVGVITILYGVHRGRKKNKGKTSYQEQLNSILIEELDLELERLKIMQEIDALDDDDDDE